MEEAFWQAKWRANEIGFHENRPNHFLVTYFPRLKLEPGNTIFVPLCGKAVDLDWLIAQGLNVIGSEFNEGAAREVFARQKLNPASQTQGGLNHLHAGKLRIFVGDFFNLTKAALGPVDAIYDRAALVALPKPTRDHYTKHLTAITNIAKQLLVTLDHDRETGPPFTVPAREIARLYQNHYAIKPLENAPISGALAQRMSGAENVQLLTPLG